MLLFGCEPSIRKVSRYPILIVLRNFLLRTGLFWMQSNAEVVLSPRSPLIFGEQCLGYPSSTSSSAHGQWSQNSSGFGLFGGNIMARAWSELGRPWELKVE